MRTELCSSLLQGSAIATRVEWRGFLADKKAEQSRGSRSLPPSFIQGCCSDTRLAQSTRISPPLLPACSARSSSLRPSPEPRSHRVRLRSRPSQRRSLTTTTSYVAPCHPCTRNAGPAIIRALWTKAETATLVAQPSALRRPFFLDARALTPGSPLRACAAVPGRHRRWYPWPAGRLQPVGLSSLFWRSATRARRTRLLPSLSYRSLERVSRPARPRFIIALRKGSLT